MSRFANPLMAAFDGAVSKVLEKQQACAQGKETPADVREATNAMYEAFADLEYFWFRPPIKCSPYHPDSEKARLVRCLHEAVKQCPKNGQDDAEAYRNVQRKLYDFVKHCNSDHTLQKSWLAYMEEHGTAIVPED